MVPIKAMHESNALIGSVKTPIVAVFFGGTSGIGQSTIKALAATGASVRVYLVGRQAARQSMLNFREDMKAVNSRADIVCKEAEISLLAETSRVCKDITLAESHVDLLFMSAGYAPFGGRKETSEGIEITQSLEYYSRILATRLLLPPLLAASAGRVVSVLAGGLESSPIAVDDLDLRSPANFTGFGAQRQYATMGTLYLEAMADANPQLTFVHSFPGWVKTGNYRRGTQTDTFLARFVWPISGPLIDLFSLSTDESGKRHLFQSTSHFFGGRGLLPKTRGSEAALNTKTGTEGGLFLVDQSCKCSQNSKVLRELRASTLGKVVSHTDQVLQPYI